MDIRVESLQFMLEQAGVPVCAYGDTTIPVKRVRMLRPCALADDTLYVSSHKRTRSVPKSVCACAFEAADESLEAVELMEHVQDCLCALQQWDIELKDALIANAPIGTLIEIGERVIPYVFALFDRNLTLIGTTSNYAKTMAELYGDDGPLIEVGSGAVSITQMVNLLEDDEYHEAENKKEPFYFEAGDGATRIIYYCVNVFDQGRFAARLVLALPHGSETLHRGAELLVNHLSAYIEQWLLQSTGPEMSFGNQGDAFHTLFRDVLFGGGDVDPARISKTLASHGWSISNRYSVVKFVFFETVSWNSASQFICRQLEQQWRNSCALLADNCIVWVFNSGLPSSNGSKSEFREAVADVARTYACKAGISDPFDDFVQIRECYAEAEAALVMGQMRDPHFWYYWFDDYLLDYLIQKATEDFPAERLASKKLLELMRIDAAEGTEYVKTLRCHLANKQSPTHTANDLFMHRTSLLRRLERMQTLSGINLDDPDEVLLLELSFRLLS